MPEPINITPEQEAEFLQWMNDTYGIRSGITSAPIKYFATRKYLKPEMSNPYFAFWLQKVQLEAQQAAQEEARVRQPIASDPEVDRMLKLYADMLDEQVAQGLIAPEDEENLWQEAKKELDNTFRNPETGVSKYWAGGQDEAAMAGFTQKITPKEVMVSWADKPSSPYRQVQARVAQEYKTYARGQADYEKQQADLAEYEKFGPGSTLEALTAQTNDEVRRIAQRNAQIAQTTQRQAEAKELAQAAGIRGQLTGEPREGPVREYLPFEPTDAGEVARPFLEKLPYAQRQYFASNLGGVYDEFDRRFPGAREAWAQAMTPVAPMQPTSSKAYAMQEQAARLKPIAEQYMAEGFGAQPLMTGDAAAQAKDVVVKAYLASEKNAREMYDKALTEAGRAPVTYPELEGVSTTGPATVDALGYTHVGGGPGPVKESPGPDPWKTALEKYPFAAKWFELPAQARGFSYSKYTPRGRWIR